MLRTRNGKIILGIVVLLLIIVAIILMVSKNKQDSENQIAQTPTGQKTVVPVGSLPSGTGGTGGTGTGGISNSPTTGKSTTPQATLSKTPTNQANSFPTPSATPIRTDVGNGIVEYVEPANPYPGSGDLDYTRQDRKIADMSNSPLMNKSMCELANLSDSWSSPIEKFICDGLNFFTDKVFEPINQLNCILTAASIQQNYAENINWEYKDAECRIIDR
ncbi:MAG: hypothetical protein NTZ65_03050 [Candidatus Berkelbacteria bacterium]|nr:hypothetical protein [Candidatus Berkelbacteria bacterium]